MTPKTTSSPDLPLELQTPIVNCLFHVPIWTSLTYYCKKKKRNSHFSLQNCSFPSKQHLQHPASQTPSLSSQKPRNYPRSPVHSSSTSNPSTILVSLTSETNVAFGHFSPSSLLLPRTKPHLSPTPLLPLPLGHCHPLSTPQPQDLSSNPFCQLNRKKTPSPYTDLTPPP